MKSFCMETGTDVLSVQHIVFFQITYAWSLPFIKSSICLTMLRIITDKPLRIVIWVSMAASVASASKSFLFFLANQVSLSGATLVLRVCPDFSLVHDLPWPLFADQQPTK